MQDKQKSKRFLFQPVMLHDQVSLILSCRASGAAGQGHEAGGGEEEGGAGGGPVGD